jgi:hypothetical protein
MMRAGFTTLLCFRADKTKARDGDWRLPRALGALRLGRRIGVVFMPAFRGAVQRLEGGRCRARVSPVTGSTAAAGAGCGYAFVVAAIEGSDTAAGHARGCVGTHRCVELPNVINVATAVPDIMQRDSAAIVCVVRLLESVPTK